MSIKVLVVDDKQMMRDSVGATLQRAGYGVLAAGDGETALGLVARHHPAAVVTDLKMPEMDGLELLGRLRAADDQLPVVLMTAYGSIHDAVTAMKEGAFDFIQKPFEGDQLVMVLRRAVEHRRLVRENATLKTASQPEEAGPTLLGRSAAMRRLAEQIDRIAVSHSTVLIRGESGSGKEVVARALHGRGSRQDRPMLCLNCAALSSGLLESELFGHEKGAFTGADQMRKGRFELADGGTLLLDEISEIPPRLQAKLLRVLQEGQFERVGSSMTQRVDVRVIATTNRDLSHSIAAGDFRQDLYYRLNVLPIHLPSLRERREDVPLLAEHFLATVARQEGREPQPLSGEAVEALRHYSWPGNVRELQNICERASVLCRGEVIEAGMIRPWLSGTDPTPSPAPTAPPATSGEAEKASPSPAAASEEPGPHPVKKLDQLEREQILRTLSHFAGNRQRSAEALGIGVRTLGLKLKKWKEQEIVAESV